VQDVEKKLSVKEINAGCRVDVILNQFYLSDFVLATYLPCLSL